MCPLVRTEPPADDLGALHTRTTELEATLAKQERDVAQVRTDVNSMIGQLKRDIMVARNRLEATRWRPDGTA